MRPVFTEFASEPILHACSHLDRVVMPLSLATLLAAMSGNKRMQSYFQADPHIGASWKSASFFRTVHQFHGPTWTGQINNPRMFERGFLRAGRAGWCLSPAYDLNPTRTDLKARILTTIISLDERTCSIELTLSQAELFGLGFSDTRAIVGQVGGALADWRDVAPQGSQTTNQIDRMASEFEHEDLTAATSKQNQDASFPNGGIVPQISRMLENPSSNGFDAADRARTRKSPKVGSNSDTNRDTICLSDVS